VKNCEKKGEGGSSVRRGHPKIDVGELHKGLHGRKRRFRGRTHQERRTTTLCTQKRRFAWT